jgi:hypothetical protein
MVACIDFFEMSEICRPKFIVRHSTLTISERQKMYLKFFRSATFIDTRGNARRTMYD